MAPARLDMRILSLTNPMVFWAPEGLGLELAANLQRRLRVRDTQAPSQIRGAITLPLQSSALALKELERAADIPGMCCAYGAMHVNGINLDDKSFWPIYEFCARREASAVSASGGAVRRHRPPCRLPHAQRGRKSARIRHRRRLADLRWRPRCLPRPEDPDAACGRFVPLAGRAVGQRYRAAAANSRM